MMRNLADRFDVTFSAVVPAHAGTHIPEAVVMGPRFRGDDRIHQSDYK
jgi:hypothetical protein